MGINSFMSYTTWFAFFIASCFAAISPGAGAILTISHALNYGFRKTNLIILSQEIALGLIIFFVGAGAGVLIASPKILFIIKIFGALWLIYMGYTKWRAPIVMNNTFNSVTVPMTSRERFLSGFITNITNVKAIIFIMATLPQFINSFKPFWTQIIYIAITMIFVDTLVMYIYAYTASRMQHFFREQKMIKMQNRFFGLMLIFIALSLFFVEN